MTKTDESPEEAKEPYWSDELLAVLAEALGDEDRARQTLEERSEATEYLRAASRGLATHVSPTLGAWLSQGETLRLHC